MVKKIQKVDHVVFGWPLNFSGCIHTPFRSTVLCNAPLSVKLLPQLWNELKGHSIALGMTVVLSIECCKFS